MVRNSFGLLQDCIELDDSGVLSGGDVLPGFELPLKKLLDKVERVAQ